jgi:transcriptional regulator with XRE-family HTH domain
MPRPEAPIETVGPIAAFAQQLRNLRARAGLTYRKLAVEAQYASGTLAYAARGEVMPTWDLTRGYIKACGVVDPAQVRQWQHDWQEARKATEIIPDSRRLAAEEMPDPRRVRTYRDLLDELGMLKIAAGDLPYRCFYFGTPNLTSRKAAPLPASTVSDLFTGKHVGRFEVFAAVVQGLVQQAILWYGQPREQDDMAWHDLAAWHLAWRRAKRFLNLRRETTNRGQDDVDDVQATLAEVATWLADDLPDVAAAALRHVDPHHRERVLHGLSLDVSEKVHKQLRAQEAA